jgi:hypothetical protein
MPKFKTGTDDFKKLLDEGGYFVDKSLLIKEVVDGNEVILLPRPRRFGKTLNMTMLRYFFAKSSEDHRGLFEGLEIARHPESIDAAGDLEKSTAAALQQIQEKAYDAQLLEVGVKPENIRKLAIVISGKRVKVQSA